MHITTLCIHAAASPQVANDHGQIVRVRRKKRLGFPRVWCLPAPCKLHHQRLPLPLPFCCCFSRSSAVIGWEAAAREFLPHHRACVADRPTSHRETICWLPYKTPAHPRPVSHNLLHLSGPFSSSAERQRPTSSGCHPYSYIHIQSLASAHLPSTADFLASLGAVGDKHF